MNPARSVLATLAALLTATGCSGAPTEEAVGSSAEAINPANNGTALSFEVTASVGSCGQLVTPVLVDGVLTSTGSVDSAIITVNGQYFMTVDPQNFSHDGRAKSFEDAFLGRYIPGPHVLYVCATQSGSNGRASKQVCTVVTFYTTRGQNLRQEPLGGMGKPEGRPAPGNRKAFPCEVYVECAVGV